MFNPLVDSFDDLNDNQLELKVHELSKKYFQTHNPDLRMQIASILDMLKEELHSRRQKQAIQQQNGENDLDNLIKIS